MIKATANLRKQIWNTEVRKNSLNRALNNSAKKLENRIIDNIENTPKTGRLYRISPITVRRTSANSRFRQPKGTSTRSIVGYRFHRASARGESPASRTKKLVHGIKVQRNARSITARSLAKYSRFLDDPSILGRPFFNTIVKEYFKSEFKNDIKRELHTENL